MFSYPARFDQKDGAFVVTFRDVPEAVAQGETHEEAGAAARDALISAMDFYFETGRRAPPASAAREGEDAVALPLSVSTKVMLLNELHAQRMRPADLARAMGVKPQEVTRLMDLHHATQIDTLAHAFAAVGRKLELSMS